MDADRQGLVLVYTGDGKGKTTAAFGAVFRALGHGWRILVVEFLKGDWPVVFGELETAKAFPQLEIYQMGRGFVGIQGDRKPLEEHRAAARAAYAFALERIAGGAYDLVVLDEICVAADPAVGLLAPEAPLALVEARPARTSLVMTGRNASAALVSRADLVTEMRAVKHPYDRGIPAQKGIDF